MAENIENPSDLTEKEDPPKDEKMEWNEDEKLVGEYEELKEETTDSEKAPGSEDKSSVLSPLTSDTTSEGEMLGEMREVSTSVAPLGAVAGPSTLPSIGVSSSTELSPPQRTRTSAFGAIKKMISPKKKERSQKENSHSSTEVGISGSMSRLLHPFRSSKSMSPPEKSLAATEEEEPLEPSADEARGGQEVSPSGKSPQKKSGKKEGLGSKLKKSLSSVAVFLSSSKKGGSTSIETEGLMNPETEETSSEAPGKKVEEQPPAKVNKGLSQYAGCWHDLDYMGSLDSPPTQLSDITSVCGSDVFTPPEDETPKESIDKTSEGTVARNEESSARHLVSGTLSNIVNRSSIKRPAETSLEPSHVAAEEGGAEGMSSPRKKPNIPEHTSQEIKKNDENEPKVERGEKSKNEDENEPKVERGEKSKNEDENEAKVERGEKSNDEDESKSENP